MALKKILLLAVVVFGATSVFASKISDDDADWYYETSVYTTMMTFNTTLYSTYATIVCPPATTTATDASGESYVIVNTCASDYTPDATVLVTSVTTPATTTTTTSTRMHTITTETVSIVEWEN